MRLNLASSVEPLLTPPDRKGNLRTMVDRAPDTGFMPISPNPFIVGNPVRGRAMFFGRESDFELVRRRFEHSPIGGLMVFCGERRSGKTSILFQILDGRLGPDFIPVLIDMQSMAVSNEVEFLTRISQEIVRAIGATDGAVELPTFMDSSSHSAAFQRFVWAVLKRHPERKLILLFDEYELFENKIDANLLSPDVLHILANLIEQHPVFVVFTGSQHLEQRRKDYWKILGKSLHKMISFLERDDALNLIQKPVEGRVHYAEGVVEAIWRLTAGQPFYTQAICQSLVDHLNEHRSNVATPEALATVVDGIVNNPLPQMIFLWDGLERNEKIVLALLAECLGEENAHAGVDDLVRHLRHRQYPLELDKTAVATTLEKLFKTEFLLRDDRASTHAYAFRMDLWRLWIRRQHSVWQVMREEGLSIRRPIRWVRPAFAIAAVIVIVSVIATLLVMPRDHRNGSIAAGTQTLTESASLSVVAEPATAQIVLDGREAGSGSFRGTVTTDRAHRIELRAAGFADTGLVLKLSPGDSQNRRIALRELLGDVKIQTSPAGAEVRVDGRVAGKSPLTIHQLGAANSHRIDAALPGFASVTQQVKAQPNTMTSVSLALQQAATEVAVTTDPDASEIRVDGSVVGTAPLSLDTLRPGRHTFVALRDGYVKAETSLTVRPEKQRVHLTLVPESPGTLVVQGDRPAEIWIDGVLVVANVQNSGPRELSPRAYQVRVIFADGDAIEQSVLVKSQERATYDYTKGTVTRRPQD
jgi:hypothetical protein